MEKVVVDTLRSREDAKWGGVDDASGHKGSGGREAGMADRALKQMMGGTLVGTEVSNTGGKGP